MEQTPIKAEPRGMIRSRNLRTPLTEERIKELNNYARNLSPQEFLAKLHQTSTEDTLDKWITNDPAMRKVKDCIRDIKRIDSDHPVLITGPTGTGKELLAKAFQIPDAPFIAVNCGGLAKDLVPSLFFGHKKGSFTGAIEDRTGILASAKEGIVFLDEIAELPLELQATLLRAIQEAEVYPVGSVEPIKIHCRFIAATKHDLRGLVELGKFREDLFARLYCFELVLTPLSERMDDVILIGKALDPEGYVKWDEPLPEQLHQDIARYNVRAIQTYIERMHTYGHY